MYVQSTLHRIYRNIEETICVLKYMKCVYSCIKTSTEYFIVQAIGRSN